MHKKLLIVVLVFGFFILAIIGSFFYLVYDTVNYNNYLKGEFDNLKELEKNGDYEQVKTYCDDSMEGRFLCFGVAYGLLVPNNYTLDNAFCENFVYKKQDVPIAIHWMRENELREGVRGIKTQCYEYVEGLS